VQKRYAEGEGGALVILVAGGTGFLGSAIVRRLVQRGEKVAVLTRDAVRAGQKLAGSAECREGDVRDPSTLEPAMEGVKVVIATQQFAGFPMENPGKGRTFEEVDGKGTENLAAAAKASGVERFIYLSGAGAAPDAKHHWFRIKWRAEEAVRNSGMTYVVLRPSWIYGPDDAALNRFLDMSKFLPFVPLIGSPGKQKVQPAFIDDVAKIVAECVSNAAADNRTFEIGGPEVLTMSEVTRTALEVAGRKRFILAAPATVMKTVASIAKFLPGPPLTPDGIDFITQDALGDPREVQEALGVQMTPVREALATYLAK
jgi:uncharacterized protein YbjT (DUF2867 family)